MPGINPIHAKGDIMAQSKISYSKEERKQELEHATEMLKRWLSPGCRVYTMLKSVSKSGMSRRIRCAVAIVDLDGKPEILDITYYVAQVCGYSMNDSGLLVKGCGMDMGFAVVISLSYRLFGLRSGDQLLHRWL